MRFLFPQLCNIQHTMVLTGFHLKAGGTRTPFQQQYKEAELSVLPEVPQPSLGIVLPLSGFFPPNYYSVIQLPSKWLPNTCVHTCLLAQGFHSVGATLLPVSRLFLVLVLP